MIISRDWMSRNGFQQHVLVKNGKVRFALMTLLQVHFLSLNRPEKNAVNLDMGRWGYGWI
jgi:hypothetical protein